MMGFDRILVTGGAGFIGSNFIRYYMSEYPDIMIANLDKLTYAGNLESLADVEENPRYEFFKGDIGDLAFVQGVLDQVKPDAIVNFAAESHVDRSVLGAFPFIETNAKGTFVLLETARKSWSGTLSRRRFIQVSTDEVYGDLGETGAFTEHTPLAPNNPYSASKASADLLCRAYHRTHGVPVIITRCSNNYGPYQFPEKLIPVMIDKAARGEKLPVYGDGSNVRDWIHVLDHCRAIDAVLCQGEAGEIYNVGADTELRNLDLVKMILHYLGRSEDLIEFVRDRPGHDHRYAMDASKLRTELNWVPMMEFGEGLAETVKWYQSHIAWVERCKTGEYQEYYGANYCGRGK